jgi:hypothetical protein
MEELKRRNVLMGDLVLALTHRAIDLGHKNLPGLLHLTEADIVENHKRRHTVPVTAAHARRATPGNPCDCAVAHAVAELPEVYAAIIMRRVSYVLEKDERGRLKVYRYHSPDQARRLTVRFDKRLKTGRIVTVFGPMPRSQWLDAQRRSAKEAQRRRKRGERPTRDGVPFRRTTYTRTMIPAHMLEPLK